MYWIIERKSDLAKGAKAALASASVMPLAYPGDSDGHLWRVTVTNDGEPVDLTGASVTGYFYRQVDGNTPIVHETVASGNAASVLIPQAAYAYEGYVSAIMRIALGGEIMTVDAINFNVGANLTGSIIDPGEVVDINAVLQHISDMETATAAAQAVVSSSVRYDTAQALTITQKAQARTNIGALATRLYISENALDLTQTDLIMAGKTLNSTGGITSSANYALFKIPVTGIDGIGYQIYAPNSNNTSYAAKGQRAAMYDASGNLLGMVVNNTGDPAYVTNADCRWMYMSSNVNSALSNGQVMVLKNAASVIIDIAECGLLPFESALLQTTPWSGMTWAAYGDSISAKCNGDFTGISWARYVNKYMGFGAFHGRSIGGQKFAFGTNGGSVSFVNTTSGNYNSRNDSYNYDNYTGTVPDGCTKVRGAFSSWLRITSMFPASIKDNIDMVFIMGGTNDSVSNAELSWVSGSTVDPEWAASSYYATYGGDYNIDTLPGGVASTIMKFQAWMPNALIVIGTPCNGKTQSSGSIRPDFTPDEYSKAARVKEIAGMFGCPVIDVYSTCSINVLNSSTYISDGTHPSTPNALKRLSKAVIGGLNGIVPARD